MFKRFKEFVLWKYYLFRVAHGKSAKAEYRGVTYVSSAMMHFPPPKEFLVENVKWIKVGADSGKVNGDIDV